MHRRAWELALVLHCQRSSWGLSDGENGRGESKCLVSKSMPHYSVLKTLRLSGFMLLFLLPRTQGYHFFPPSEVGTLQFANYVWTTLCVVSVEPGHFPVASNAPVLCRSSGRVTWICKSLFLAVPAHSVHCLVCPHVVYGKTPVTSHRSP